MVKGKSLRRLSVGSFLSMPEGFARVFAKLMRMGFDKDNRLYCGQK
jgi:hypothetical protein